MQLSFFYYFLFKLLYAHVVVFWPFYLVTSCYNSPAFEVILLQLEMDGTMLIILIS